MFAIAFLVMIVAISALTLIVWTVHKFFFKDAVAGSGRWGAIIFASSAITAFTLGAIGTYVVPSFANVYTSFGAELPNPTRILVSASYALWLPALLLLFALRTSNPRFYQTRFLATLLAGEVCVLLLVLWALYLPVHLLGCG